MLIEYRGKNEDRQHLILNDVLLIDGFNDVNPTQWKAAIANPHIAAKVEAKKLDAIIVIHSEDHANQSLKEVPIPDATKIIKDTFDVALLKEWKDHETRKGILKEIDEQLAKIEKPEPPEDNK